MFVGAQNSARDRLESELLSMVFQEEPLASNDIEFILNSYSEPWRRYHNCSHILLMLKLLHETAALLDENGVNAIEMMIVYHDVVYKLGREKGWNENESAVIAGKQLTSAGYSPAFIEVVTEGIKCTIDHKVPESLSNWGGLIWPLIDIDLLAGFGTSWEEFSENTRLIGLEFSPLYTEGEYTGGRAKFAASFLERPEIFHTPGFRKYEPMVRENLARMAAIGS